MKNYSISEVADSLNIPVARIKAYVCMEFQKRGMSKDQALNEALKATHISEDLQNTIRHAETIHSIRRYIKDNLTSSRIINGIKHIFEIRSERDN